MTTTTTATSPLTAESLITLGGSLWEKNGMRRVYFNDLPSLYGLKATYYNTGNISSATLDGDAISNAAAREIQSYLKNGKLFYDLVSGEFGSRDLSQSYITALTDEITRRATV